MDNTLTQISLAEIDDYINQIAPYSLAEHWDNVGLLIGNPTTLVSSIMLCLDITNEILDEAVSKDVHLIITHHPVIFAPIKRLDSNSIIYKLSQHNIAVISAHTNLDLAENGVNHALANLIELQNTAPLVDKNSLGLIGELPYPLTPCQFADKVKSALQIVSVRLSSPNEKKLISRVAVIGGNGSDEITCAIQKNADAYLTGEVHHQHYIESINAGLTVVDAGHFSTESIILPYLLDLLLEEFPKLNIFISDNDIPPYITY